MGASTNSRFSHQYGLAGSFAPICSYEMLRVCTDVTSERKIPCHVGNILSSDTFYSDESGVPDGMKANDGWRKMGIMAIEMEAAGLYMTAAAAKKNALAICTISDHIITGEATTSAERETSFTQMIGLALETAKRLA